jgi:hypothetical protein
MRSRLKRHVSILLLVLFSIVHEPNDESAINLADEGSESDDDDSYSKDRMETKIIPALPSPA